MGEGGEKWGREGRNGGGREKERREGRKRGGRGEREEGGEKERREERKRGGRGEKGETRRGDALTLDVRAASYALQTTKGSRHSSLATVLCHKLSAPSAFTRPFLTLRILHLVASVGAGCPSAPRNLFLLSNKFVPLFLCPP